MFSKFSERDACFLEESDWFWDCVFFFEVKGEVELPGRRRGKGVLGVGQGYSDLYEFGFFDVMPDVLVV